MQSTLKQLALGAYKKALDNLAPKKLVEEALELSSGGLRVRFLEGGKTLSLPKKVFLLSVGKAACPMAEGAISALGKNRFSQGLVVTKYGFGKDGGGFPVLQAGHPVPDEAGLFAAKRVMQLLEEADKDTLVLLLVSGGASALLPAPIKGLSLELKQDISQQMLHAALDIHEMNHVRKTLSRLKGGGLVSLAGEAQVLALYLSDVPGDSLASIGSGLTAETTSLEPSLLKKLALLPFWKKLPPSLKDQLQERRPPPSPQPSTKLLHGLIGCNQQLLLALEKELQGFHVHVEPQPLVGLNLDARKILLKKWEKLRLEKKPTAWVCGGETVVKVKGGGLGGRCQELAALLWPYLLPQEVFLAAGSDGNDGPTDAAGGLVDHASFQEHMAENRPYTSYIEDNNTYNLLQASNCLLQIPPTRNNLMDVYIFLRSPLD